LFPTHRPDPPGGAFVFGFDDRFLHRRSTFFGHALRQFASSHAVDRRLELSLACIPVDVDQKARVILSYS
jgi:hypothetical protein